MTVQGSEIACHADTHIEVRSAEEQTVRTELELSKQKIPQEFGVSSELFAYQFGGKQYINDR